MSYSKIANQINSLNMTTIRTLSNTLKNVSWRGHAAPIFRSYNNGTFKAQCELEIWDNVELKTVQYIAFEVVVSKTAELASDKYKIKITDHIAGRKASGASWIKAIYMHNDILYVVFNLLDNGVINQHYDIKINTMIDRTLNIIAQSGVAVAPKATLDAWDIELSYNSSLQNLVTMAPGFSLRKRLAVDALNNDITEYVLDIKDSKFKIKTTADQSMNEGTLVPNEYFISGDESYGFSTEKIKENIEAVDYSLFDEFIDKVDLKEFDYIDGFKTNNPSDISFIIESLEANNAPFLDKLLFNKEKNGEEYKAYNIKTLLMISLGVIKVQKEKISKQDEKIQSIGSKLDGLIDILTSK